MSTNEQDFKKQAMQYGIDIITTITGMSPPPIEESPTEIWEPFIRFSEKIYALHAAETAPLLSCIDALGDDSERLSAELSSAKSVIAELLKDKARQAVSVPILKGIGKINGDGFKDTTEVGEVVFVWAEELPEPYQKGQYLRVGKEHWAASTDQYDFQPATVTEVAELFANLQAQNDATSLVAQALEKAADIADDECSKLQTDDKSNDYWMGVGDALDEFERIIRALITQPIEQVQPMPEEVRDALMDSQYKAGVKAGWNAAQAEDPGAALKSILDAYEGSIKPLRDWQKSGRGKL